MCKLSHVGNVREAEAYLSGHHVDVVLLDLESGGVQRPEALRQVGHAAPRVSIVLRFSLSGSPIATQAMIDLESIPAQQTGG